MASPPSALFCRDLQVQYMYSKYKNGRGIETQVLIFIVSMQATTIMTVEYWKWEIQIIKMYNDCCQHHNILAVDVVDTRSKVLNVCAQYSRHNARCRCRSVRRDSKQMTLLVEITKNQDKCLLA